MSSQIEEQAAFWLACEDRGTCDADKLNAWLEQSSLNRVAYLRLKSAWRRADRLAALRAPISPARRSLNFFMHGPMRYAAGIALAVAIGGGGYFLAMASRDVYATPIGAREVVALPDGSKIEINTDSKLRADVTGEKREVTLERGEAFFDVVHDEKRPFTVLAGNRRIVDVGTKFSVRRDGDKVDILIVEGEVRIEDIDRPKLTPVLVESNKLVITKLDNTLVVPKTPVEISNSLGWRKGMLIFSQQSLDEVAAEFNRYNQKQLIVAEGHAAAIKIGGSFDANNVEAFARLIHEGFGLKVADDGEKIKITN